jgi:hypothetical protein
MASKEDEMGRRGPLPKGAAHAIARGYYRPSRHGPRPSEVAKAAEFNPWDLLRLDRFSRPRPLDPIEELLQREGIEITPEDRRPKS